jgi:hypothetical protein
LKGKKALSGTARRQISNAISADELRPRYIEGMIDQGLHAFEESHGVRQRGVDVEGFLVPPARVNVEQLAITDRTKGVNAEAAGFFARRSKYLVQRIRDGILIACTGMKASENE